MKVKILKTGKVSDYPAEYCARLYEQGKAVFVPDKPAKKKEADPVKTKPETKEEKPGEGD